MRGQVSRRNFVLTLNKDKTYNYSTPKKESVLDQENKNVYFGRMFMSGTTDSERTLLSV